MKETKNKYASKGNGIHRRSKYPDPFEKVITYVPKSLMKRLQLEADRLGIPVERLLVRASMYGVELEEYGPFEMDLSLGASGYSSVEEQQSLYRFLCRADRGVDLDLLLMTYDDIGLRNEHIVKNALCDLVTLGLVELYNKGDYPIPKVRAISEERLKRGERFKAFAGEKTDLNVAQNLRKKRIDKGVL